MKKKFIDKSWPNKPKELWLTKDEYAQRWLNELNQLRDLPMNLPDHIQWEFEQAQQKYEAEIRKACYYIWNKNPKTDEQR